VALSHSPSIVTNGLVLCLDAANRKGYDKFENLTLQTSQIGITPTYSVGGIVGLNTTATTAPNGLYEASLVDNNGNTSTNYVYGSAGLTTNTTYTYSIHIKQGTKPDFQITIDENGFGGKRYYSGFTYSNESVTTGITGNTGNDGALIGSSVSKLTNGWYRLSLAFKTSTTAVSTFVDMINRFGNTSGSNYVWGRQLEIGDTTTDYYATTSTAKNRGTIWSDLSGNGNTGTLTNGVGYGNSNSGSFVFDGVNDCVVVNNNASILSSTSYTKIAWFYPTSFATLNNIISGVNGLSEHAFWLAGGNTLNAGHNGSWSTVVSSTTLSLNTWYCGAVTFSTTTGWVLYLNGVQEATNLSTTTFSGTGAILIGAFATGDFVFTGRIANTKIYNRVLSAAEVRQNFNALRGRFGI
jgi:hypothetical protein